MLRSRAAAVSQEEAAAAPGQGLAASLVRDHSLTSSVREGPGAHFCLSPGNALKQS